MKICQNCGYQLRDDSMFCINCGAKLTNPPVPEASAPMAANEFEAKANELKRLLDELTAAYVSGLSSTDAAIAANKARCDVETAELRGKLERECETTKSLTAELESVKAAVVRFSTENASLKAQLDAAPVVTEAAPEVTPETAKPYTPCPNCNTLCSPDMSFCNECGTKLK